MTDEAPLLIVRHPDDLPELEDRLLDGLERRTIALDVEEDRMMRYRPTIALLQVSWVGGDAILDPIALPAEVLAPVVEAICLAPREILMHGAQNDVTGLKRDFGVGPERLVDTQFGARFAGRRRFGLASLLEEEFDIRLEKETRMSDWTARPLSARQIEYARRDTAHLIALWDRLRAAAEERGFGDAVQEESRALAALQPTDSGFDPGGWEGMKGIGGLDERARVRLAALWELRDTLARTHDMHPTRVMPPWLMIQLAERGARALQSRQRKRALDQLRDLPGAEGLEALLHSPPEPAEDAGRATSSGRRSNGPRPPWNRHAQFDERLERLQSWRNRRAESTGLESGLLAPRALLEQIADVSKASEPALEAIDDIRQWRTRRWSEEWLELL